MKYIPKKKVPFTEAEANKASYEWNFNCGPAALCAALDMTPDEIRPHLLDFEEKGYTNPTLMTSVLKALKVDFYQTYRADVDMREGMWPTFGLVRIQWDGPWTKPGVPMQARYRQTHWVAAGFIPNPTALRKGMGFLEVFDVNAMHWGGWLPHHGWSTTLIPWLIPQVSPKANGGWWPTHVFEIAGHHEKN